MIDSEKLDKKHSEVPPDYYETGLKNNFWQRIWHTKRIDETIKIIPGNKEKYLDIGCNGGLLMKKVADKCGGREVWGMDISEKSIKYAQKKYPNFRFKVSDAINLPFEDNYFDLITCLEVLEHIPEPKTAIQEMRRCLKIGGELVLLVPTESIFFRTIWYFWTRFGRGRVWHETHVNKIKSSELENILEEMDFEIVKSIKTHAGMLKTVRAKLKGIK